MLQTDYEFGTVQKLTDQIATSADKVQFRNVFANDGGGVVLIGFRAGQKLDTHTAPAEVMVNVIEGEIRFTMLGTTSTLRAGEFLLMGANVPHSVEATTDAKVMLVKIK